MFTLIFVCLIIIFGFEYAGLVNREKNLEFRQSFVKGISVNNIYKTEVKIIDTKTMDTFNDKPLTKIEKENKIKQMYGMLAQAAESNKHIQSSNDEGNLLPDVVEFFD